MVHGTWTMGYRPSGALPGRIGSRCHALTSRTRPERVRSGGEIPPVLLAYAPVRGSRFRHRSLSWSGYLNLLNATYQEHGAPRGFV